MSAQRFPAFTILAAVLFNFACIAVSLGDETVQLQTSGQTGDLTRVTASLAVEGKLFLRADGKEQELPLAVKGHFSYDEAALGSSDEGAGQRAVRYYREADAEIAINKHADSPKLRDDRRLILVDASKSGFVISSLSGPLTREELDLIDIPGNSLTLEALLPSGTVKAGETWKPSETAMRNLLGLEAVSASTVECSRNQLDAGNVEIAFAGQVDGAVAGVSTEIHLEGKANFDRRQRRLNSIQMRIKERRSVGHVSPGLAVVADLKLEVAPLAGSDQLTETMLHGLPAKPAEAPQPLSLHSEAIPFELTYDRRWHVTRDDIDVTVLRLLDRGELVAQCNVSPLAKLGEGKQIPLDEFQADVQHTLGKNFGAIETGAETKNAGGLRVLKVVASGVVSELPIEWRYYLVSDASGRRVAISFTLEKKLAERFADADVAMIESLTFLPPAVAKAEVSVEKR